MSHAELYRVQYYLVYTPQSACGTTCVQDHSACHAIIHAHAIQYIPPLCTHSTQYAVHCLQFGHFVTIQLATPRSKVFLFISFFYPFCLRNNHEQHKEAIQNGFGVYHLPCANGQELEEDLERLGCSRQDFDWAVSLLHSRCFIEGPNSRHMTVPGIDMANHSFSPNASVR